MKDERPVNLNLFKFHFPIMAIVSILHRVTGVIVFLFIPALLYVLHASLSSPTSFSGIKQSMAHPVSKIALIVLLACAIYHLFAGIRHLVLDMGIGESKRGGRVTAWIVNFLSIVATVLIGVWLW